MKLGIIIQTNNPEKAWNGLRLGITALKVGHIVKAFLLSEGVEVVSMKDDGHFDVAEKLKEFVSLKGELMTCGTCLKIRQGLETENCPISTMNDLLLLVEECDRVISV